MIRQVITAVVTIYSNNCTTRCIISYKSDHMHIQGVSPLVDITAGGDFLGLCDQKRLHKHVSDFGRLWSYGHFSIRMHALV